MTLIDLMRHSFFVVILRESKFMILRHFTKAHNLLNIIQTQTILREKERHLRIDNSLNRKARRFEASMMKKVPAFTWLTSANRANTSFGCLDMNTKVRFREAFCIEIESDDIDVVSWDEYATILRRKKFLSLWINEMNTLATDVGDDKRNYYVVRGDIDLSSVAYRVRLMQYKDGVDFATYMRTQYSQFDGAEEIASAFEMCRALYADSKSTFEFANSIMQLAANDDMFTVAA